MREIEDVKGVMMKEKGIMRRIEDLMVIEVGLMMREGIIIEGKMMMKGEQGEVMNMGKKRDHVGEMMREGMKEGVILMAKEDSLMKEAEVSNKKEDKMRETEHRTGEEEDLVIRRETGMIHVAK